MKLLPALAFTLLGTLVPASATVLVSGFTTSGTLNGQTNPGSAGGTWTQIGAGSTNPLTVTSGTLAINPSGQGLAIQLLSEGVGSGDFYYGVTLNLSAAQSGNMFLSFAANNTAAPGGGGRLYAQASGEGYVLGGSVGSSSSYGSTVLSLNTEYRIVFHYNLNSGSGNDNVYIYVNPTNTTNEGLNTPYLTLGPASGLTSLQYFQITQTSAGNGPTGGISNLIVSTTFSEAAVPEPAAWMTFAAGVGFLLFRRNGRRS